MKIGIKLWSTNEDWFDKANDLYDNKKIDYVELYTVPGTYNNFNFEKLNMPIIIHGPHFSHGLNLADPALKESNLKKVKESIKFADRLRAKYIILHPGYNGKLETVKDFLKNIKDERIIIENMPKKTIKYDYTFVCYTTEKYKELIQTGFGFCLDFSHAVKAAISTKKDYKEVIEELLELKPKMFHISDGDYKNEMDQHLNLGEGKFDLKYMKDCVRKSKSKTVTLETPKAEGLSQDIKNIKYFNNL